MSAETRGDVPQYVVGSHPQSREGAIAKLELSPRALDVVNQLVSETGEGFEDVFRKALSLYKAAVDAHREGKSVGVASSPDVLETEFVGF